MKRELKVQIDHVGLFACELHPAEVMFKMGFVGEAGASELMIEENGLPVRCVRFMLDNGYLECAINRDPSKYCGVSSGVNYFEFESANAQNTFDNAVGKGFAATPVHHAVRKDAHHGEKTGDAIFECVSIGYSVFPTIETESVCHLTRELFYDNKRYIHKNGVTNIDGVILACESEELATDIEKKLISFQEGLGTFPSDYTIRSMFLMDPVSIEEEYKVSMPEDNKNTIGVILNCEDKEKLKACLNDSNVLYTEVDDKIIVDFIALQNMYFIFK